VRRGNCKLNLTFVGPCIVIYFYSKTNQMHNISNLFYFETKLYIFRTVSPSVISSLRLYIQHQVYVIQVLWLLPNKQSTHHDVYNIFGKNLRKVSKVAGCSSLVSETMTALYVRVDLHKLVWLRFKCRHPVLQLYLLHFSTVKPTRCAVSQICFILEQRSTCFGLSLRPSTAV